MRNANSNFNFEIKLPLSSGPRKRRLRKLKRSKNHTNKKNVLIMKWKCIQWWGCSFGVLEFLRKWSYAFFAIIAKFTLTQSGWTFKLQSMDQIDLFEIMSCSFV